MFFLLFQGQFNFACIIIQPLDHNTNKVTVKAKDELTKLIGYSDPKIVSDQNVAILARQLALHANVSTIINDKEKNDLLICVVSDNNCYFISYSWLLLFGTP